MGGAATALGVLWLLYAAQAAPEADVADAGVVPNALAEPTLASSADAGASAEAAQARAEPAYETIVVVGTTPLHGSGLPKEKIASNVQVATGADLERLRSADLAEFMNSSLLSVHINDVQNNPYQPDVQYRGFTASPLLGLAQGLVAYVDGVRANETFGDTLNWDLIPHVAIAEVNLIPGSNPVYGLNTLGGALSVRSKNGWSHPGLRATAKAGSDWRKSFEMEVGGSQGSFGYYVAGDLFSEEGWRAFSPTDLKHLYATAGWHGDRTMVDLSAMAAQSVLSGNGPSPAQLLAQDRRAVFTHSDETLNTLLATALRATRRLSDSLQLDGNASFRSLYTQTFNGDDTELGECVDPLNAGFVCRPDAAGEAKVLDPGGAPIPVDPLGLPFNATNNITSTGQRTYGATLQLVATPPVLGRTNQLVVGAAYGGGNAGFSSRTELAHLASDRGTLSTGIVDGESMVNLRTVSHHWGAYFTDTLDVLPDLAVTLSGRFNLSTVELQDQLGTALNGFHRFIRFNPSAGVSYQPLKALGAYFSWGESSRAPTPVELSCASPADPCRLPNGFLSDPPLAQVVAHTFEGGLRGALVSERLGTLEYAAAAFRTQNSDDIIFVSGGALASEGFFANVGSTLRQGVEVGLSGRTRPFARFEGRDVTAIARVGYTAQRATFQTGFTALSPNHPMADGAGHIDVPIGASMPGIPNQIVKVDLSLQMKDFLSLGVDLVGNSGQYLRGDEANLLPQVPGFAVLDAVLDLTVNEKVSLFARISNVLDQRYETFGVLGRATNVLGPTFDDPRFLGPGAPRCYWAGLSVAL